MDFKKFAANIISRERSFFPSSVPHELKELYLTMTMLNFALSSGMLFEPIYLYSLKFTLTQIMLYYFSVYVLYFFLMPIGGRFVKSKGFKHGIFLGSLFLVCYFISLLAVQYSPIFLALAVCFLAVQKMFFWPGYHADFVFWSRTEERGREYGVIEIFDSLSYVIGPVLGGILIHFFGFAGMFTVVCILILFSNIPLLSTKEIFKPSTLAYREPYAALVKKENRPYLLAYMGYGEELVFLTVWPIFVYVTFGSFLNTGAAITLSTLITAGTIIYVGRLTDKANHKKLLRGTSFFVTLSWIVRLFIKTRSGVIFADFFSRATKYMFSLPFFSGLYKHASQTSIVRTMIFFEMSLTVGKLIMSSALALLFYFEPHAWNAAFILAALFSLLYFILSRKDHPESTPQM